MNGNDRPVFSSEGQQVVVLAKELWKNAMDEVQMASVDELEEASSSFCYE